MEEAKEITIGERKIGKGQPCFIIAEAGVNHNSKLEIAKKLVDAAKEAGADAVKFQTFKSENLVTDKANMASYQKKNLGVEETQLEMLKKLELGYPDFKELKEYCDEKGIIFLSTPHTEDAVDFLEPLVPAFKIGSGDLTNLPHLEKIAKKNKPVIISTGMGTLDEVREAVDTIRKAGNDQIVVLHCTTHYPCQREDVNLRAMQTIEKEIGCLTGYSDHTIGIDVSLMAAKLGAVVIEKHFTLDKNMEGPDHIASLEPKELKELVSRLREGDYPELDEVVLGSEEKKPNEKEDELAEIIRKSIVTEVDIDEGATITEDMLIIKRPGTGMLPKDISKVIGKKAKRLIKKDSLLKEGDIE